MKRWVWAFCLVFVAGAANGRAQESHLAFEVASVKAAPPPTGPGIRVGINQDKGRITMSNVTLRNVLTQAYKVKEHQLVTPDWMESIRFDIVAKLPEGATKEQVPEMLRTLLAERFQMKIHKESKVLPVYAMIVAKGGPKLTEAEAEGGLSVMMSPAGRKMNGKATVSQLADSLSNMMDRPVLDETGLKGVYQIDLTWSPDDSDRMGRRMGPMGPGPGRGPEGGEAKSADAPDAPSIFIALQEKMGLKLDPRKAPAEIIVVDSAEKVPTEN